MFKIGHSTNGDIIEPKMAISQLSTDHRSYENTETALYSLMKPMPLELSFPTPSEVDADRKYKFSALMLGRKGSIPVLFGIELKRTTTTKNSVVILEPVPEKDLDTQMKEVEGDSSIRCMIIPGLGSKAVCRECLAMHSKWFAIRSYILFYKERRYSAELLVVTSNYESSDIETNCRKNLCSNVFSWDPSDCQIMDSIFPSHRKLFEVHQKKYGLNEEHHICNENAMDLNWIRQVLNVIAFERMQRASRSFGPPQDPFFFSKTLEVLRTKMTLCINVTLFQSARWMCIGCILKNVGGARLLISSSLRNAMILTSDIKSALKCIECSNMMPLEPERCKQYRDESVLNIETFPKPSGYEVLDEAPKNCIVVYYMSSRRNRCLHCMKKTFSTKKNPSVLSKTSSLFDTSKLGPDLPKWSVENALACHHKNICVRLQKVPNRFCSEHAAFLSTYLSKSIVRVTTITYTQREIPVGIWPPQKHYILMSHYKSERVPDLPRFYSNEIALVQFEFARSTFEDCASCLVEHTEVFFAYKDKSAFAGYVWMRPTPSKILRLCVEKLCSCLNYGGDRKQAERPVGIRQLTKYDILSNDREM